MYRREAAKEGWEPTPEHVMYRGLTYIAETDEQAEAEMGAFFGANAAEQAKLPSATMGGPPLISLILQPYFVGGPETVTASFDVLLQCGVGVFYMVFTICTHDHQY